MKKTLLAGIVAATLLTGCGPNELTSEQKQEVASLQSELAQTEKEIAAAAEQQNQYTGGLIRNLATARLEILGTNKALLEQRINAIESGAKIAVTISGIKPNPEAASALKNEIENLTVQLTEAKKDASQYNGGLLQVLKLSTVATQEQTLAMLQQRYLSAKYGLAEVKLPDDPVAPVAITKKSVPETTKPPVLPPVDGPFGLEAGLSKKNIEDMIGQDLEPLADSVNLYTVKSLPKISSDFEVYGLLISPNVGLCEIRAVGKDISTDRYGLALQSKYEDLSNSLSSIYGKAEKNDFLLSGSIWKDPQDWMMALNKKERFLSAKWVGAKESPLKNNLQSVSIEARANSPESGYIFLQYTFSNSNICKEEIDGAKKSAL
ncbi:TPA: hypothetical protein SK294_003928 [Yersinia enterocolitica]|nr:hypothetical protein [Yersinia enterocolitica]HEI6958641.1 hypothetical protein [Yersinia enterocolitica]